MPDVKPEDRRHHRPGTPSRARFLAAGLALVVSSDNPGIFGTTLNDELDWSCEHTGGGADLRRELITTAWNSRSEILTGRVDS